MQDKKHHDLDTAHIEREHRLFRRTVIFGLISGFGLAMLGLFAAKDDEMVYSGLGIMIASVVLIGIAKAG